MIAWILSNYKALALASLFIVGFTMGWYVHGLVYSARQAESLREEILAKQEAEQQLRDISADYESKLALLRVSQDNTKEVITHEIQKIPVYRDCILPVTGVQLINETIAANNAARKPAR